MCFRVPHNDLDVDGSVVVVRDGRRCVIVLFDILL